MSFKKCFLSYLLATSAVVLDGSPALAGGSIQAAASSVQNSPDHLVAQNAVDGNPRTRWSSEPSDAQWLLIDMGATQDMVGLELSWETARAKAYNVMISLDGEDWLKVYGTEKGEGTFDDVYFGMQHARYVKLLFHKRATSWGYSLWEVHPLGADQAILATTSSSAEGSQPEHLVDGNAETIWRSGAPGEAWVELDLSHPRTLGGLVLNWGESYAQTFRTEVSADGKIWKVVDEESQGKGGRDERRFTAADVRFVRVVFMHSNAGVYALREGELVKWETVALESSLEKVRGLVGAEGCGFKIHTGRDGSFAPEPWPFQVGFWMHDRTTDRFYTPETLATEWKLDDGRLPISIVSWKAPGLEINTSIFSRWMGAENRLATFARTTIHNTGAEAKTIDSHVWVKPSPLERARGNNGCREIEYDGSGIVKVDGKIALFMKGNPDATAAEQPAAWAGVSALCKGEKITGDEQGAKASVALRFRIEPGQTAVCDVVVPSGEAVTNTSWAAALDYESNLEAVRQYWRERTPMVLDVPDRDYADCFYSSLNYLLILKTGNELRPGPYVYTGFFLHDAVEMVEAFDKAGVSGVSRAALNQFHYNFGNYLDELGGSIYALYVHYLLTGDKDFLREVYPRIEEGCRQLQTFRAKQLTPEYTNTELYGLLPPSASQDNFSKPAHLYLDNWWGLIGLRVGMLAAATLDKSDDAKWMGAEYNGLHQDILTSIDRVMKRERVNYMPGFADNWPPEDRLMDNEHRILGDAQMAWAHRAALCPGRSLGLEIPTNLFKASYEHYWEKAGRFSGYDGGWFVEYENAFWGYNVLLARPLVYLGMKDVALKNLEWNLQHQSCPGAWMEAMPSRVNAQGLREIAPGIMGDVPHGWSAAHYVLLVRDMLLYEEDDRLVLLSCVPDRWFEPGRIINVEKAVTYFGLVDFRVKTGDHGDLHIELSAPTPPPGGYLLILPHPTRVRSAQVDGKEVAIVSDGKLILPPTAHNVTVQYESAP
ncbi:MAG: discoidin domain-containing protein [Lentisphaerota bacterium]